MVKLTHRACPRPAEPCSAPRGRRQPCCLSAHCGREVWTRLSLTDLATGETTDRDNHIAVRMKEVMRVAMKERLNAMGEAATVMGRGYTSSKRRRRPQKIAKPSPRSGISGAACRLGGFINFFSAQGKRHQSGSRNNV
jgi:hypothetical protein